MIVDNDPLPTVSFGSSKYETIEGEQAQITLMLSTKSYQTVEVNLTIDAQSTATEMDDYNLSTKHVVIEASNPDTANLSNAVTLNAFSDADEADDGENVILHIESTNHAIISSDANTSNITIVNAPFENLISQNVFMDVDDGSHGAEPWMSDGSVNGTYMLKDIEIDGNSSDPQHFTKSGGDLYFTARNQDYHPSLYKSDGSSDGTEMVHYFGDDMYSNSVGSLTDVNGVLYYIQMKEDMISYTTAVDLYRYNKMAGEVEYLANLKNGYPDGTVKMTVMGNAIYFVADTNEAYDLELYKYDIATGNYGLVKDINTTASSEPKHLTIVGETLYFAANGGKEIWKSEGTESTTVLLSGVPALTGSAYYEGLHYVNGYLYASVTYPNEAASLLAINESTGEMVDSVAYYDASTIQNYNMVDFDGSLYYLVLGNSSSITHKFVKLTGFSMETTNLSDRPSTLRAVGGIVYLKYNSLLQSYDGSSIQDIKTWESGTGMNLVSDYLNGELYFSIDYYNADPHYDELWKTDGTPGGTSQLEPSVK